MSENLKPTDCMIVIFGASGDLTKRKLIPALYDLHCQGMLPENFAMLGISRTKFSDEDFRERMREGVHEFGHGFEEDKWHAFSQCLHYHAGDSTKSEDFKGIKQTIEKLSQQHGTGDNLMFYLSMAPRLYDPTIENLGAHQMITEGKAWCSINRETRPWQRIIVEKPFGHDLDSAAHLNRVLGRVFEDESVYRIDHYLGKETVQNIFAFRFANSIFEPVWNRTYVDHVQITAAETVGVEGRGGYYDSHDGGAMRDMIQSHLLQLMTLIAMEPPVSMRAKDIRSEATKALIAARKPEKKDVAKIAVRGQYISGKVDGKKLPAFRDEEGVDDVSTTETYAALQVFVDTWRWRGVPFYLRSGKRLKQKVTEIVIYFRATPHSLFQDSGEDSDQDSITRNQIVISVAPDEGIRVRFVGKVPGIGMKTAPVVMDFDQTKQFADAQPLEGYALLLWDAMRGDQTNFKQREEIEQAWAIVQPVLDQWKDLGEHGLHFYESGVWGPDAADEMMSRDGRHWHVPGESTRTTPPEFNI